MQDNGKAQKMSDIYGHILLKPLAFYDQNTLSWKTCEDILALDLRKFSATLPKMGMMLNGVLYEQVMSELLTKEPDSSLLPTPTAGDHKYRIKGNSQASKNLQALAKQNLLPTPTAMHVRNHDEPIEKYQQRVQDFNEGKTLGKPGASTGVAVRLLATPTTKESHHGQMPKLGGRFISRREMCLQEIPNTLVDGKLNAKFVEYMMGLPDGWVTDLDLSRAQQLKMLGNGVVPQQAYYALELLHE
jgi:hypothetical protein